MGFIFHAYATRQVLPSGMALVLPWDLGLNSTRHKAARGLGAVAWNIKSDCGYIFVHCHNSYLRFHALFQRWDYHFVKLWILIENREYLVWGGKMHTMNITWSSSSIFGTESQFYLHNYSTVLFFNDSLTCIFSDVLLITVLFLYIHVAFILVELIAVKIVDDTT